MKSNRLSHFTKRTMAAFTFYALPDLYPIYKRYLADHLGPRCRECGHYGPPETLDGYFETHRALKRLMHENPLDPLTDISDEAYGAVCWVAVKAVGMIDEQKHATALLPSEHTDATVLQLIASSIWPYTICTEIFVPARQEESPDTGQHHH